MANFSFTEQEVKEIGKKLGFIVDDWAKNLMIHIIKQAKDAGVRSLYMNSSDTLDSGANEGKVQYFYERLPAFMGFKKETVNFRNKPEVMWAYHFYDQDNITSSSLSFLNLIKIAQKMISLSQIPRSYQGAVLSILGKKESYGVDELKKVLEMIKSKDNRNKKPSSRFFYDWTGSRGGSQSFRKDIVETVVLQKISSEWQDYISENPALLKFWSYLLSQLQHFSNDTIGFGLICKIDKDTWVINQIQTDVINKYRDLVKIKDENENQKRIKLDFGSLKDMLETNNRSNWIPYVESNIEFREQLLSNPNDLYQLCDNNTNITEWLKQQGNQGGVRGMDLIRHFQSVNLDGRKILRGF